MLANIQDVASTIQTVEGWFPGSLSYRLNNPGNLTYVGQAGATPYTTTNKYGVTHTWAMFDSFDSGYQALLNQIKLDASRGLSIQQFVNKYAPSTDNNNVNSYANSIASQVGLSVMDPLSLAIRDVSSFSSSIGDSINNLGSDINSLSNGFDFSNIFSDSASLGMTQNYAILIGVGVLGFILLQKLF